METKNFYKAIAPRPIALITTIDEKGNPDVAPFSFIMPVSIEPPIVCFSAAPQRKTLKNIRKTKEFTLNIPSKENLNKLWFCAQKYSGDNKIRDSGLTEEKSIKVKQPRIKACIAWIECTLDSEREYGDHVLVAGKVVEFDAAEDSALKTLLHIGKDKFTISGETISP